MWNENNFQSHNALLIPFLLIRMILQIWILTDEKGIEWRTKQTCQSYLWPLTGDDSREFTARSWRGQLGRRWKADDTKLKGMHETDGSDIILLGLHACVYKEISYASCLERLLQGKGSAKYAYKDSYKEKTSKPRKRLLNQGKDVNSLLL